MFNKIKYFFRKKLRDHGKNNYVPNIPKGTRIIIDGDNNKILIDPSLSAFNCKIKLGDSHNKTNSCTVKIGKGCTSNGLEIILYEHNSSVTIGEDCMFSWRIRIFNTDAHSILDETTGKVLNIGKEINIGNHVWVGMDALILKNTTIPSNCVVGAHSLVNKKFTEENTIIAGHPAKVVKRGITWDRKKANDFC